MIAYRADWVCPATSSPVANGVLLVDGDRIHSVTSGATPTGVTLKAFPGSAILPGFVNPHAHLELTLFKGLLHGPEFPNWIARLVRMKYQRCSPETLRISAQLGAREMLKAGVTAVGEVMDVGSGWEAMLETGLQGIAYQEVFGPAEPIADAALRSLTEKVSVHRQRETETQRIGVSPHAPYTVSMKLFKGVRDYARLEGLSMTTHIAESREETLFVREGTGAFAESHLKRGIEVVARGCSPVAYLDQLGLLGRHMLLVHAIETTAQDFRRIRESGSSVVHCPRSNAFLHHGVAPVAAMRREGIPVSLGTDSVASNDTYDMFAEMRMAMEQQGLSPDEVFRMATIEGARALQMERHLGSLEAGKRADFIVVGLNKPTMDPLRSLFLESGGPGPAVHSTYLGGEEVVNDLRDLRDEIDRIQENLRKEEE